MPNQKRIELRHVVKIFDIDLNLLERLHFRFYHSQIALSFPFLATLFYYKPILLQNPVHSDMGLVNVEFILDTAALSAIFARNA